MATTISKEYGTAVLDALDTLYPDGFEVALLKSAPTVTGGTITLGSSELSAVSSDNYARITVDTADFSAASGNNPVVRSNENALVTAYNEGESNWESINYVALIDASDHTTVVLVVSTAAPVTITPGRCARIAAGALTLRVASA